MAVEDDYRDLARQIVRAEIRDQGADGRTLEDMRVQMDALWRQRKARRGYRPPQSGGTGASGPTGPAQ